MAIKHPYHHPHQVKPPDKSHSVIVTGSAECSKLGVSMKPADSLHSKSNKHFITLLLDKLR